jgi:biopolymer transport protein ExbD
MIFCRNKSYWFLVISLALCMLYSLFILENLEREEKERIRDLSYLTIPVDGEFYFGKDKISWADVPAKIVRLEQELSADYVVHIRASKYVKLGFVMDAIKAVQEAGHQRIAIPTRYAKRAPGIHSTFAPIDSEILAATQDCSVAGGTLEISIPETDNDKLMIRLDSQIGSVADFSDELIHGLAKTEDKTVCVRASGELPYGRVAEVMHAAKQAGARTIHLMMDTDKPAKKSTKTEL